ncbi:MAG: queuosine precursor transporter, partial [Patescibacteria group bacterium]
MEITSPQSLKKLLIALTLYLTSLFAANTLGIKLMPFLFGSHLSVAVFSFPIVFITTDVIGEVYGKATARLFVLAGVVSIILFLVYTAISAVMPWSEDALWAREGYGQIFGLSTRFSIASVVAFAVAEYQDVIAFFFFRKKLGSPRFWLRSNLSNLWSQFLDTTIFMLIAFVGIYSLPTIIAIIIPWWLFKVVMGLCYTPLSYLGIRRLKGSPSADAR